MAASGPLHAPVPSGFEVPQPSLDTITERETAAQATGLRPIESAWPSQEPRAVTVPPYQRGGGPGGARRQRGRGLSHSASTATHPPRGELINSRGNAFDHSAFTRRGLSRSSNRSTRTMPMLLTSPVAEDGPFDSTSAHRRSPPNNNYRTPPLGRDQPLLLASATGSSSPSTGPGRRHSPPNTGNPFQPSPGASVYRRPANQPILRNDAWRNWQEVWVKTGPNLPLDVETYDLYREYELFGEFLSIEIYETDRGVKTGYALMKFTKIVRPFWEEEIEYINPKLRVPLKLQEPHRPFKVPSPVNKEIIYPEVFRFRAQCLKFGFMYQPDVMMAMYSTKPMDEVTFEVDLYRRLLDIRFRILLNKAEHGSPTDEASDEEDGQPPVTDRHENYRFRVSLAQLGSLFEGPSSSGQHRNFILPLPSPPMFWRKLHQVENSHERGALYWNAFDAWYRQTCIVYNPRAKHLKRDPISLQQQAPIIDMGRWTLYHFTFELDSAQVGTFDYMIRALKDFNVDTKVFDGFQITDRKDQLVPVWDFLDAKSPAADSQYNVLSELVDNRPVLPYTVRYQLEVCVSRNCLNEYNLDEEFVRRLAAMPEHDAVALLELVADRKERIFSPMDVFNILDSKTASTLAKLPEYCTIMRRAIITPSMVYFGTPSVETTNRVLRHFSEVADRFLRVQFKDEVGRINSTDKTSMNEVFTRVKNTFDNGITIGDRHFQFLAYGNSQMREHGAYFFASTEHVTAADIRAWMGRFEHIRVVAKHAARLGQCFSTSRAVNTCKVEVKDIPDVERNGYTFTDGVGKISEFLAKMISAELTPVQAYCSCFQFRLGGCKGVLTVWPGVEGREVHIRPSQRKFSTKHNQLEVVRCSQFSAANLNRQLIIVLSCLGVEDVVFHLKLTGMLQRYQEAVEKPEAAVALLRRNIDPNQSTLQIAAMVRNGFMASQEPFVISCLHLWRAWTIKYLKEKARIIIDKGAFLLGVTDETETLRGYTTDGSDYEKEMNLPEIFCQISDPDEPGKSKVITGTCVIARNPALHPGDVRTVTAVDVPALRHLVDVVVFPQNGDRDLPSMLSGGDLDGDDYIVIWDEELTGPVVNHPPMNYFAQEPRTLDRDVRISDITKFYVNYMKNDRLGTIANNHLSWADRLADGVKSDKCYELAQLHSDAVDYPKTGEPATMPKALRIPRFPHFMEKDKEKSYKSEKILGQLYDMVECVDFVPNYNLEFNSKIIEATPQDPPTLAAARELKMEYDSAIRRVMAQYDIKTEFEVFSTFVLAHDMGSKDYKFHEELGRISYQLKDRFQKQVMEKVGASSQRDPKLGPFVATMYAVTAQDVKIRKDEILDARRKAGRRRRDPSQPLSEPVVHRADLDKLPLISFPWIFSETLGQLALHGMAPLGDVEEQLETVFVGEEGGDSDLDVDNKAPSTAHVSVEEIDPLKSVDDTRELKVEEISSSSAGTQVGSSSGSGKDDLDHIYSADPEDLDMLENTQDLKVQEVDRVDIHNPIEDDFWIPPDYE